MTEMPLIRKQVPIIDNALRINGTQICWQKCLQRKCWFKLIQVRAESVEGEIQQKHENRYRWDEKVMLSKSMHLENRKFSTMKLWDFGVEMAIVAIQGDGTAMLLVMLGNELCAGNLWH